MPVYKRNQKWYYRFSIRGVRYGRAIPEARTKWQAEQAEAKTKESIFSGRYGGEPSNITLRDFVERVYLPWAKSEKRSWKNDRSRSKPILAYFKNKKMREINRFSVEQFRQYRRQTTNGRGGSRSPASVDREIQLLSRIFSLAIERGEVEVNPCMRIKMLGTGNQVLRYLKPEEEQRLFAVLDGRRRHLMDIVLIGLHTGMRRTEILSLHKSQIDAVRDSIELTSATKSGKPRSVPIHPDLKPLLHRLCEYAKESGYLFENAQTGSPIKDVKTAWRNALRDAGITGLRFHDLRHTFGTRAVDGGAPVSAVKDVMGHVDIGTTMRYVHATDDGKRRAVDAAVRRGKEKPATNLPQTLEKTA